MELILVRHGEPAWSVDGHQRNDPELTARGRAQAAALAARLADHTEDPARGPVDRLLVSPAVRAQETAAPIAEALGLEAETVGWLLELNNPAAWDGAPIEEIEAAFAAVRTWSREQFWEGLPGGEAPRDFHQRIRTGLGATLAELGVVAADAEGLWDVEPAAPERVVVVAHGGTNSAIVAALLNAPPEPWEWERFTMGHASVAVVRTSPIAGHHLWSLRALGDGTHLAVEDRTY